MIELDQENPVFLKATVCSDDIEIKLKTDSLYS